MFAFLYKLFGWKVIGLPPYKVKKAIWVGAPHHSNWDLAISLGARATMQFDISFLAKKQIFQWYSGWLFRALGGLPVDRSKANNLVDNVVQIFQENDSLHLAITPEGTRDDVPVLKRGFYYMALNANVPLILVGFDYPRKAFVIREALYLSGDYQKDMQAFYDFYLTIEGPRKTWLNNYVETGEIPDSR
ncbi:1-acyl-sn-glycerol-3-phosphate acyltransferase [Persicitalea jodogahamensis]|uniref:Acyltransferase n=1 Tax=Persicitalea jodogahamensis TaxID=402147 RepID=A0A8J3D4J6_9BACT|nr:1-acyl-sn-glycerol-3-phosphate acyltransferase [Persicitalea jodogahamensis]GHB72740.1 acyltransferase [Persicitalea jodogahamensis]